MDYICAGAKTPHKPLDEALRLKWYNKHRHRPDRSAEVSGPDNGW